MTHIEVLPNELLLKIFQIILCCYGWDAVFKLRAVSKCWMAVAEQTLKMAEELSLCGYRPENEERFYYSIDLFLIKFSALSPKIKSLKLTSVWIDFVTLEQIKNQCPEICQLSLRSCRIMVNFHQSPDNLKDVQLLDISGTPIRQLEFCHILSALPNLYSLIFNNMWSVHCFTILFPKSVFDFIKPLRYLHLDMSESNRVGEKAIQNICEKTNLYYLTLNFTFLNVYLVFHLRKLSKLKVLKLSFYSDFYSNLDFPVLPNLEELYLKETAHSSKQIINKHQILDLIRKLPSLKKLSLEINFINEFELRYGFSQKAFDSLNLFYVKLEELTLTNLKNLYFENFVSFNEASNLLILTLDGINNITYEMVIQFVSLDNRVLRSNKGIPMSPQCCHLLETDFKLKTKIRYCKVFHVSLK